MPVAWILSPYKRIPSDRPVRHPLVMDFINQVRADGGDMAWTEVLGDQAICKVRALTATLDMITSTPGITEIPRRWARLVDSLADMTAGERNIIQNRLLANGYTQAEIDAAMGSTLTVWRTKTLLDLLNLVASRVNATVYHPETDTITVDGPPNTPTPVTYTDQKVPEVPIEIVIRRRRSAVSD